MKERVGDEKLIIISVAVRGINDHIRFYDLLVQGAEAGSSGHGNQQQGDAHQEL